MKESLSDLMTSRYALAMADVASRWIGKDVEISMSESDNYNITVKPIIWNSQTSDSERTARRKKAKTWAETLIKDAVETLHTPFRYRPRPVPDSVPKANPIEGVVG